MALRGLVEGECGAANPLVQWTSHFSQEKSMLRVSNLDQTISFITCHDQRCYKYLIYLCHFPVQNGLEHDRLADLKVLSVPFMYMYTHFTHLFFSRSMV